MAKTKISEFSSTPANNTDIDSINIAEGCAPSGINDAIRELMSQLKDFQTGAVGDSFNGPVGATTAGTGAFTTLSASSTVSGTGFSTYLASPPAIGGTAAAAVSATTLSASSTLSVTGAGSIQGLTVGRGAGAVSTNTVVGNGAFATNSTGIQSVAFGFQALQNSTGGYNDAFGYGAGKNISTGDTNTAIGRLSIGNGVTTGGNNVGVGAASLYSLTSGGKNVGIGVEALTANTTASNNTAVGYQAGYTNTGSYSTFIGYQAGYSQTTGNSNTCVGQATGYGLTTGTNNTFISAPAASGSAGYYVTTGSKNTIIGAYNGNQSSLDIRTASNYIVLSDGDGNPRAYCGASGQWNMGDGSASSAGALVLNGPSASNGGPIMFGQIASATKYYVGSYSAILGGASNGSLTCQNVQGGGVYLSGAATSWSAASDERRKDIIEPITNAANKVSQLRAVIGKYKTDAEGVRRSFLIAQDVQAVLPEAVNVMEDKDGELLGVQYTDVIPLLVAAIKELKAEFDAYKLTHP